MKKIELSLVSPRETMPAEGYQIMFYVNDISVPERQRWMIGSVNECDDFMPQDPTAEPFFLPSGVLCWAYLPEVIE